MDKKTLKDALDAALTGLAATDGEHIRQPRLYDLLRGFGETDADLLTHLVSCPSCAQQLRDMAQSLAESDAWMSAWDLALPKAAGSPTGMVSWRLSTEGGRYTIELHPHSSDQRRGIISLQVAPQYRDELEGRHVSLWDTRGRLLLEGRIVSGEVVQLIADLDKIDPGFVVRAE